MSFGPKLVSQLYPTSKRGRETNVAFLIFHFCSAKWALPSNKTYTVGKLWDEHSKMANAHYSVL